MSDGEEYQWDAAKRADNLRKHGVDFTLIHEFDWDSALTREDTRADYGETRFVSIGNISDRLFVAVWTRRKNRQRLISLRRANKREETSYGTAQIIY